MRGAEGLYAYCSENGKTVGIDLRMRNDYNVEKQALCRTGGAHGR